MFEFISGTGVLGFPDRISIHDEGVLLDELLEGVEHLSPVDLELERGEFLGL